MAATRQEDLKGVKHSTLASRINGCEGKTALKFIWKVQTLIIKRKIERFRPIELSQSQLPKGKVDIVHIRCPTNTQKPSKTRTSDH